MSERSVTSSAKSKSVTIFAATLRLARFCRVNPSSFSCPSLALRSAQSRATIKRNGARDVSLQHSSQDLEGFCLTISCANLGPGFRISGLNCLYYFVGHIIRSQDFNQLASVNCIESLAKVNECKDAGQVVSFGSM